MNRSFMRVLGIGLAVAWFWSLGCVKRAEQITVTADGRVRIALHYEGPVEEIERSSDAMPSDKSGWEVTRRLEKDGDDEVLVLTAERSFPPGARLPSSFAAPEGERFDLDVKFPTTLHTEPRADGVYYHFRRVYAERPWAYVRYWEETCVNELIKEIAQKPLKDLTEEERRKVLQAFADFEAHKLTEFVRAALREVEPDLPQDHWLLARQRLLRAYRDLIDWERIESFYQQLAEDERDRKFVEESERIQQEALVAVRRSLRADAGLDDARLERFMPAFERARRQHAVTEAGVGHHWLITVDMPGEIVAHNADGVTDEGLPRWEFSGASFRDRPFEIMITSRVKGTSANP